MAEEEKKDAAPAEEPAAAAEPEPEKSKKSEGGAEKQMGKFTHGDHMVHILFQKGKKFVFEDER